MESLYYNTYLIHDLRKGKDYVNLFAERTNLFKVSLTFSIGYRVQFSCTYVTFIFLMSTLGAETG